MDKHTVQTHIDGQTHGQTHKLMDRHIHLWTSITMDRHTYGHTPMDRHTVQTHTDGQTHEQTHELTDRQHKSMDNHINGQTHLWTDTPMGRHTAQTPIDGHTQTHKLTDRHIHLWTAIAMDRHTYGQMHIPLTHGQRQR